MLVIFAYFHDTFEQKLLSCTLYSLTIIGVSCSCLNSPHKSPDTVPLRENYISCFAGRQRDESNAGCTQCERGNRGGQDRGKEIVSRQLKYFKGLQIWTNTFCMFEEVVKIASSWKVFASVLEFLNKLCMGARNREGIGPARLHRLAESIAGLLKSLKIPSLEWISLIALQRGLKKQFWKRL
jgi:hypothetical protein